MIEYTKMIIGIMKDSMGTLLKTSVSYFPLAGLMSAFSFLFGINNADAVLAFSVLVVIDFLTGLAGAKMQGDTIESKKAIKSVVKFVFYCMFISASYLTEKIVPGTTFIDEITISFLAITELISIMENIGKMGYEVPLKLLNNVRGMRKKL